MTAIDPAEHVTIALWVAHKYARRRGLDAEEVIGDAYLGLVDAARRFDPSKGVAFATYAHRRVMGAVLDAHRTRERPRRIGGTRVPRQKRQVGEWMPGRERPVGERIEQREEAERVAARCRRRAGVGQDRVRARREGVCELALRGLEPRAIAASLGCTTNNVQFLLSKLRAV